ncbi:MAG: DUF995 domain-containing protein [Oricola sp.]
MNKVFLLALSAVVSIGAAASAETLPPNARPVGAVELYMLYKDKTWQWEHGAGRFYAQGRRFLAWSEDEQGKSYADGRFILTDRGRVCMDAAWRGAGYSPVADQTCFVHFQAGGTIYQRKEGTDFWYTFKHERHSDVGEYAKFVDEDIVTEKVEEIRKELADRAEDAGGQEQSSQGE